MPNLMVFERMLVIGGKTGDNWIMIILYFHSYTEVENQ